MSCDKIKQILNDPTSILIDVRTQSEYALSRVMGATLIPLHELPINLDTLQNKNVYLYCRSGARSAQGTAYLQANGIKATNIGGLTPYIGCLEY